jgi:acyl carrier protein
MKVQEFLNLLCQTLALPSNSLSLDDTPLTVPQWDSMAHLDIIGVVERKLGVAPNDAALHNFTSIRQLVERLKARNALED